MVVRGTDTRLSISNSNFHNSSLLVEQGAQVTLLDTSFNTLGDDCKPFSIIVRGEGSRVTLNNCAINGGPRAASISNGASMHARRLTCTGTEQAIQVSGLHSRLELRESVLIGTAPANEAAEGGLETAWQGCGAAVVATNSSMCHVEGCQLSRGGVYASECAEFKLLECKISNCGFGCCVAHACSAAHIEHCAFEKSCGAALVVSGGGDAVAVRGCTFVEHRQWGLVATTGARVKAHACASGSCGDGYQSTNGATLNATECISTSDSTGFCVEGTGSKLTLLKCSAHNLSLIHI